MLESEKEQIRIDFRKYLKESDLIKEKRAQALTISGNKKSNKIESYKFDFMYLEYKLNKGDYPIQPSAHLETSFDLEITTTTTIDMDELQTIFTYNCVVIDNLNAQVQSNPRFEVKDLKEFKAFIHDEEVKLDKGTAKKISSNLGSLKINDKIIKEEFKKLFNKEKESKNANSSNFSTVKTQIEEIVKQNNELDKLQDMMDKSADISKIVKKYNVPIQKIVYYRDILVIFNGYLNEQMRIKTKKLLDSYDTELWSINDTIKRKKVEEANLEVLKGLKAIGEGKLIYKSNGEQIEKEF